MIRTRMVLTMVTLTSMFTQGTMGQTISESDSAAQRAETNTLGSEYPRIDAKRRITFRIAAPNAQLVQLMPGGKDNGIGTGPFDMTRGADGVWTIQTEPAVPGFHYYWFLVDGVETNDRGSHAFFGWGKECSGVEVPDPKGDFYANKNVPHGHVRSHWYYSPTTKMSRRAIIYTPPGYDHSHSRYPVLYLQHGAGESETGWTEQGHVNFIIDNLIAERRCEPLIVVMENGMHAPAGGAETTPKSGRRNSAFGQMLVNDLVPEVDREYRTLADSVHRAIAGLSMGAGQALQIGLASPDFAYVGAFSGISSTTDFSNNPKLKLLWAGCGTAEDQRFGRAKEMIDAAQAANIHAIWHTVDGTSHEWQTWRYCLREFAPQLFQD